MKRVELGDIFEYEECDGPEDFGFPTIIAYRIVQQILNNNYDVAAGRVILQDGKWRLTRNNSGSCVNRMIGNIVDHIDLNTLQSV